MSEWRERANERRDERQTKMPDIRAPSGSGKNTKRWCRGKVGRPHAPARTTFAELKNSTASYAKEWQILICENCRKELDYYWPSPFGTPKPPPQWAVSPPAPGRE